MRPHLALIVLAGLGCAGFAGCVSGPQPRGTTVYLEAPAAGPLQPAGNVRRPVQGRETRVSSAAARAQRPAVDAGRSIGPELRRQILALDPEHISPGDIERVLSRAPAPQFVNIHGGIYPVHLVMVDFSRFLAAMGYPAANARLPRGEYSYSCYMPSARIAGAAAWYHQQTGLPVFMVGHSQGGIQLMKVLHDLAGTFGEGSRPQPWNPKTGQFEERTLVRDPRPVFYAAAVASGGAALVLPNQWVVGELVRKVPDSTRHFTGYYVPGDILGGGIGGPNGANAHRATGRARVRNVVVRHGSEHVTIPKTHHLAKNSASRAWISSYQPSQGDDLPTEYRGPTNNLLWAADVWYEIRKHWCLALQEHLRGR